MKTQIKIKIHKHNITAQNRNSLEPIISAILQDAWGYFPRQIINSHIFRKGNTLYLIDTNIEKNIAFLNISHKTLLRRKYIYFEFMAIKKAYQSKGLGTLLVKRIGGKMALANFPRLIFTGLNVLFITPNLRLLALIARFADDIYPNPWEASRDGTIMKAPADLWQAAQQLILHSDNPTRHIQREGLVLMDSYRDTPWLIYKQVPWHSDSRINLFGERYLKYGARDGREFIVFARYSIRAVYKIIKYIKR